MFEALGQRLREYAERDGRGYPDWAVRYVPVVKRLHERGLVSGRILEIGANEAGLARFLGRRVIVVDVSPDHLRAAREAQDVAPVVADASALPFRDRVFDVCASMDTFEHLAGQARGQAASEIVRILTEQGVGIVAFPAGEAALRAEQEIRRAYAAATGNDLPWLAEHEAMGLPEADRLATTFAAAAGQNRSVAVKKNATLWMWQLMWRILMCGWPGRGNAVFQVLLRLSVPVLCRMHFGTCYRTMIWVSGCELSAHRSVPAAGKKTKTFS